MPIFGALAGLTAAGLYAAVDELRVAHKIKSHQLSGGLIASMDYKVNDARFDGIIRRFENDWRLDGGTLYPAKMIGFFAENPKARQQWVRMQASILLHDSMQRRSSETDTKQFGDESIEYERIYGDAERAYICNNSSEAEEAVIQIDKEYQKSINLLVKEEKDYKRRSIVSLIIGVILVLLTITTIPLVRSGIMIPLQVIYVALSFAIGLVVFGCVRMMYKKNACLWAFLATALMFFYTFACHSS